MMARRPGFAAIFVKAFCLVAKDEPVLRTLYAKWPWPHFYELPRSVGTVAIARVEDGDAPSVAVFARERGERARGLAKDDAELCWFVCGDAEQPAH